MYDIYDLKCDSMFNPIGITKAAPKFSWKLVSDEMVIRLRLTEKKYLKFWRRRKLSETAKSNSHSFSTSSVDYFIKHFHRLISL